MNAIVEMLNAASVPWWDWISSATWQSALVATVVIGAVALGRRWPAPLRHALLLVAMLKFAFPPLLPLPVGLFSVTGPRVGTVVPEARVASVSSGAPEVSEQKSVLDDPKTAGGETQISPTWHGEAMLVAARFLRAHALQEQPLGWRAWVMLAHFGGTVAISLWLLRHWLRLGAIRHRAERIATGPLWQQMEVAAETLGVSTLPELRVSKEIGAPVAFGILRPTVLLPLAAVERLGATEVRTILAHELAHFRRGDLWVNAAQLALLGVWWFHPLFWLLRRAIRGVREECCDDLLLAHEITSREAYCQVLVSAARELAVASPNEAAIGFGLNLHPLSRRLIRIMDATLKRAPKLSPPGCAVVLVISGLLLPGLRSQPVPAPSTPPRTAGTGPSQSNATFTTNATPSTASDGKPTLDAKYTNKPQGLLLRFPGGWDVEDLGAPQSGRWDLLLMNPGKQNSNAGIHLTVYKSRKDADEVFRQVLTEQEQHAGAAKPVTEGTATVGGRQSRFFKVLYPDEFELRYCKVYVVTTDKALYVFRCVMDDPDDAVTARLLDAIVTEVSFR